MPTFVDTSAIFSLLDADDEHHARAQDAWDLLADRREQLVTSSYVAVETVSLLARRLGLEPIRTFHIDFAPALNIIWVDERLHNLGMAAVLTTGRRDLSLVDCVSFEVMRQQRLDTAFAFDAHFAQQGFRCVP